MIKNLKTKVELYSFVNMEKNYKNDFDSCDKSCQHIKKIRIKGRQTSYFVCQPLNLISHQLFMESPKRCIFFTQRHRDFF